MNVMLQISQPSDSIAQLAKELNLGSLQEPVDVPFTFETIGWQILTFMVLLVLLLVAIWQIRRYWHNRYRREALAELQQIVAGQRELAYSFVVLKRTAILAYSREKVGSLSGKSWLQFLEKSGKKVDMVIFERDIENLIYKGILPEKNIEQKILINTEKWIRTHAAR